MGYQGRFFAVGVVILFNMIRYLYYHQYLGYAFKTSFFILTCIFLLVAWAGGRQYDLAKFYAERDPLTNVYNRRTIDKAFEKQAAICKKKSEKLAVVLIDLDKFKDVNDKFGHQKGDELLRYVADVIKKNAKKSDIIVRWGGDEFVHIVPNIDASFRSEYVEMLKYELAHSNIDSISSIGASIGISIYPDEGESFEVLVQQADASMYEMKAISDRLVNV